MLSSPKALIALLCILGDLEWEIGSPITAKISFKVKEKASFAISLRILASSAAISAFSNGPIKTLVISLPPTVVL